jgi:hypothetical protein
MRYLRKEMRKKNERQEKQREKETDRTGRRHPTEKNPGKRRWIDESTHRSLLGHASRCLLDERGRR